MDISVSMVLPTFDQERYITESLASVLNQDYPPAEIIIADDCSADATFQLINKMVANYHGPHTVRAWQNKKNLGTGNVLNCIAKASGDYIVVFHGDDISFPWRTRKLIETLQNTSASLVCSNAELIDQEGVFLGHVSDSPQQGFLGMKEMITGFTQMQATSNLAFERKLCELFLPWTEDSFFAAVDHVLNCRASVLGGVYVVNETLLKRRVHNSNFSKEVSLKGVVGSAEVFLARFLATYQFIRRDLKYFQECHQRSEQAEKAIGIVAKHLDNLLEQWARERNLLLNNGSRPIWVSNREFKSRTAQFYPPLLADRRRMLKVSGLVLRLARGMKAFATWINTAADKLMGY